MRHICRSIAIMVLMLIGCLSAANADDYVATDECYFDAEYYTDGARLSPTPSAKKFRDFLETLPESKRGAHPLNSEENFPAIRDYINANSESDPVAASLRASSIGVGCYGYVVNASGALIAVRKAAELGDQEAIVFLAVTAFADHGATKGSEAKRELRKAITRLQETDAWARRDSHIEVLEGLYLLVDLDPQLAKGRARPARITETCQRFSRARDLWPRNRNAHIGLSNCYQYTAGWRYDLTLSYAHWLANLWLSSSEPDTYSYDLERRLASDEQVAEARELAYRLTDRSLPTGDVSDSVDPAENGQEKPVSGYTLSSSGTAFFISESLLTTNAHVIADARRIKVTVDGEEKPATVVVADPDLDLAILKIDQPFDDKRTCFSIQNAGTSTVGSRIFAAGFPYSGILSSDAKITEGVVSSKNGIGGDPKTFQISTALQPGNSGGPVFDETGKLVGIAVSSLKFGQNVNFAIKPLYLQALIESAETNVNCVEAFRPGEEFPSGFERTLALVENYQ